MDGGNAKKCVNIVDPDKFRKMTLPSLPKASIQPKTGPDKFAV